MKSSIFALFLATLFASQVHAQLDDYKYIVVPKKFDVFSKENQHQTSTLIKHLFTKKGFTTVYDDAYPDDLNSNRCLGLYVALSDDSSMFVTKTILILKDCKGREVFMTQEGSSKNKEFKAAYNEAISEAFKSFTTLNYQYSGKKDSPEPVTLNFKNDVKKLEETKVDSAARAARKNRAILVQEATKERHIYKNVEPVDSDYQKGNNEEKTIGEPNTDKIMVGDVILYAQEIGNGYQLVDSTPAVRLKMSKTTMPDIYLASNNGMNGLVYKRNDKWILEYYVGDALTSEELNIKF